jgi:dTDP-4-amino-4,6-dideoxygalactose transaminase
MKDDISVPFLDLITPHKEKEEELTKVFRGAILTGRFIGGSMVQGFENAFASFCETEHCIGVGSGTDALRFALIAAGVKERDIVITVPNTFIATTEAITQAGALPRFVDIEESSFNMDPERLREYIETQCTVDEEAGMPTNLGTGRRVAAVVPVHLYGHGADMDAILDIAAKYNLIVVEDACQAHGAKYFSQKKAFGNKLDQWAMLRHLASILEKIWAPAVRLVR